jgi:hypothetical protein
MYTHSSTSQKGKKSKALSLYLLITQRNVGSVLLKGLAKCITKVQKCIIKNVTFVSGQKCGYKKVVGRWSGRILVMNLLDTLSTTRSCSVSLSGEDVGEERVIIGSGTCSCDGGGSGGGGCTIRIGKGTVSFASSDDDLLHTSTNDKDISERYMALVQHHNNISC